jgi:hypothetical protein
MMNKRDVLQILEQMPEEIDPNELMYRVFLLRKLQAAEADLEARRYISHEDFVRKTEEWLK